MVLQEISLHTSVYIDSDAKIDFDTVPTLDELMTFMKIEDRIEPIGKRAMFLALYDALFPHAAKVLEPLNRQAKSRYDFRSSYNIYCLTRFNRSAVWIERFSPDMD